MKVKALLTSEESMALVTFNPVFETRLMHFTASMTYIVTLVVFFVVISGITHGPIIVPRQEGRHARNDIVVIVMEVQINLLLGIGSAVDNAIEMIFGHNKNLVARKDVLKFFNLIYAAFFMMLI